MPSWLGGEEPAKSVTDFALLGIDRDCRLDGDFFAAGHVEDRFAVIGARLQLADLRAGRVLRAVDDRIRKFLKIVEIVALA